MKPYYDDGRIQIYHGDCREILPTLPNLRAGLVLTDPPYGIQLQDHGRHGYDWTISGDNDQSLGSAVLHYCREQSWPVISFASPMKPWPGKWRQHLVWDKGPGVGGGGDPKKCWKNSWELIQVAGTGNLDGKRDSAVLRYWMAQDYCHLHPCQKPVELLTYLIVKAAPLRGLILDPFLGSGSTLRSAKDCGMEAIGIELEERYCEIAARRLEQEVFQFTE